MFEAVIAGDPKEWFILGLSFLPCLTFLSSYYYFCQVSDEKIVMQNREARGGACFTLGAKCCVCLAWPIKRPLGRHSNPVNTDTEGAIENVRTNGMSLLSGLNLVKM